MSESLVEPNEQGVRCDYCRESQFRLLHHWPVGDYWNPATTPIAVWICENCGLVLLYPVPTAAQLPGQGDWFSAKRKDRRRNRLFKTYFWEPLRIALTGQPCTRFVKQCARVVRGGRFLDVGCGRGAILERASIDYDECTGIEPSPVAVETVRAKGLQVMQCTLENAQIEAGSFDMVLMDSVIEHVHSPTLALAKMNSWLRIGGGIALKTPKFGGPSYLRHRGKWNGFRQGYHTYLYTGKTLSLLMQKCGFEVCRRPRRDRPLDDILILYGRKIRNVDHLLGRDCPVPSADAA